jgi:purine-binding chemotaxis protein CheW
MSPTQTQQTQVLTFMVEGEEYGIDILHVQEIRGWSPPKPLPNAPPYIKGVINIRGDIVPIADLRERMGLSCIPYGPMTAVVVLRSSDAQGTRVMGIVVDAMSDVSTLPTGDLKPPPEFGASSKGLASAIVTSTEKMITILDIGELFGRRAGLAA